DRHDAGADARAGQPWTRGQPRQTERIETENYPQKANLARFSLTVEESLYMILLEGLGMRKQVELVQGTLDMLILKAVSLGGLHGYGVLLRLQQLTGERLQIQQGSLYPALYRLERKGLIASEWGESE